MAAQTQGMTYTRNALVLASIAVLSLAGAETKIKLQNAPAAVQATVKTETANAKLVGLSKEIEHGKTMYELETKVNGHGRDLMIAEDGSITSVEEEVALDSVPPAVKEALVRKAGGGKITKVEAVTENGNASYEAAMVVQGKKLEYTVDAQGKPTH
jgi:uncharacterized membrane protein YkoI